MMMTPLERKVAALLAKDCASCRGEYYEDHAVEARAIVKLVLQEAAMAIVDSGDPTNSIFALASKSRRT